jgi:hypothetical protein
MSMTLREGIIGLVSSNQGMKGTDLAVRILAYVEPHLFNKKAFFTELQKLIDEGEIVEIEYCLESMDWRIKSFYLPKGTKVYVPVKDRVEEKPKLLGNPNQSNSNR